MKYRVQHSTEYRYDSLVKMSQNQLMLSPISNEHQVCHEHRIVVQPTVTSESRRRDFFGNQVYRFSVETGHRRLAVTSHSVVTVKPRSINRQTVSPAWEQVVTGLQDSQDPNWLLCAPFRFDSPRASAQRDLAEFAGGCFLKGAQVLQAGCALTEKIFKEFKYDGTATDVNTEVATIFKLRRGVCQDFAHFQLACFRTLGLAARYVSGYLRTLPPPGKPRLIGADQSHAWVSLYCGPELGWVDLDPTNNCICGQDHITVAVGRDYGDVMPFRGVFLGGGPHQLNVSVDVCPLEQEPVPAN